MHDALCRELTPRRSGLVMDGKWGWFQRETEVDLLRCSKLDISGNLAVPRTGSSPMRACVR